MNKLRTVFDPLTFEDAEAMKRDIEALGLESKIHTHKDGAYSVWVFTPDEEVPGRPLLSIGMFTTWFMLRAEQEGQTL